MREAPSIPLITALQDMGAEIRAFDPVGMPQAKKVMQGVTFCNSAYACAKGAHALVIVTEWEQFRALDLKELSSLMASSVIVDLRNIYSPDEARRHGFYYCGVGRPKPLAY
jgi:UDPglucose 6-dehydrogenase